MNEKLGELVGTASLDEIKVYVSIQLYIYANRVGVAKGRGMVLRGTPSILLRGMTLNPKSDKSISASNTENKVVLLTTTVEKLLWHIKHKEGQLRNFQCYSVHHSSNDNEEGHRDEDEEWDENMIFSMYFSILTRKHINI